MSLVWRTRRAERAEAEALRRARRRAWQIGLLLEEKRRAEVLAETGVDLLAGTEWSDQQPAPIQPVDGGEGREQEQMSFDQRSSSESLSDHIRQQVRDGREGREQVKRLPDGIPDAALIPDDPRQGDFEDRRLWSR